MLSERIKDLILIRLSLLRLLLYDIVFLIYFELQQMTPQFWRWSTFYSTLLTMIQICKNLMIWDESYIMFFRIITVKTRVLLGIFVLGMFCFGVLDLFFAVLVFIKLHWKLSFFLFTFYAFLFVFLLTENITLKSCLIWFKKKSLNNYVFFNPKVFFNISKNVFLLITN